MRAMMLHVVGSLLVLATLWVPSSAWSQDGLRVAYAGELIDGEARPLSGVFPLRFQLSEQPGGDAVWTELRYVAVVEGIYDILLGRQTPLPTTLANRSLILQVALQDGTPLMQHTLRVEPWTPPASALRDATVRRLDEVELAARTIFAERARVAQDCRTLQGRTFADLNQYDTLLQRLQELRTQLRAGQSVQVGREPRYLERVGADSGRQYTRICPPNQVVTGARGGAGNLVDGMQLICSPIQSGSVSPTTRPLPSAPTRP